MRLFAAVEIPKDVRVAVANAARGLVAELRSARLVAAENLHMTIRFLGETSDLDLVLAAAREAAASVTSARAEIRGFGVFPNLARPRILWAGVDDPARAAARLEEEFSRRVEPLGFPREERPFTAHVTVARLRDERGWNHRRRRAASLPLDDSSPVVGAVPIERLTVFASELSPDGPRYEALGRFPLQPLHPSKEQS